MMNENGAAPGAHPSDEAPAVYPELTIYATREAGRLVPVAVALAGISVPVTRAALVADANARTTGTAALCAELTLPVGGGGIVEVGGMEDVPDLAYFTAADS